MRLFCPSNREHDRFNVPVVDDDVHVINRSGEWVKTYEGSRSTNVEEATCDECEVGAFDAHSYEVQSLSDGDRCPHCGTVQGIQVNETQITCKNCQFMAEVDRDTLNQLIQSRLRKIGWIACELRDLGSEAQDVADFLNHEVFPSPGIRLTRRESGQRARFADEVIKMMVEGELGGGDGFEELVEAAKKHELIRMTGGNYFTYQEPTEEDHHFELFEATGGGYELLHNSTVIYEWLDSYEGDSNEVVWLCQVRGLMATPDELLKVCKEHGLL